MMKFGPRGALSSRTAGVLAIALACMAASDASAQATKKLTSKSSSTSKKAAAAAKAAAEKAAATPIRFVIGPTGNEARYRVREQLMGANLPNDAVGKTSEVTGTILAYPDGRIIKDSSKIVVNLKNLKSDKDRRDGFLQRRTLETEKYPTVEL